MAKSHADVSQFDDARRRIREAFATIETSKERWSEAEVNRLAGEIALRLPERDVAKARKHFERALAVARQQQAKSWELRASMSLARLWCDQGKSQQARELLAPVYGWFTEGLDTPALSRIDVGTSRPSALAVVILSTVSYFTDNCTGRSAGFSLLRMRST